jgi:hypothetical protein
MAFTHQNYNSQFLQASGLANTAEQYGIRIVGAEVAPGESYWKAIGVHHLLPDENRSNHHVYFEVLDENSQRITNPTMWIGWTWEGRRPEEPANPAPVDKPAAEPGSNIAVFKGQTISVWVNGASRDATDKSDRVENIHTNHADEPLPDGALLNTIGHHSFYIIFQRIQQK